MFGLVWFDPWWSLVWPGREAKSRPTVREADTLPTEPTWHGNQNLWKSCSCEWVSMREYAWHELWPDSFGSAPSVLIGHWRQFTVSSATKKQGSQNMMINRGECWQTYSRYLAQNAAIWLADEVLRYRDHDTSRCQDDISWHLVRNNQKDVTLTMVRVLLRETVSLLTFIMNVISINFIACFRISCWFLQTLNYRGNKKYVLVLYQCHDGMITNSINLFCVLHSSSTRARPNRLISFVIIASWHWTRTRT